MATSINQSPMPIEQVLSQGHPSSPQPPTIPTNDLTTTLQQPIPTEPTTSIDSVPDEAAATMDPRAMPAQPVLNVSAEPAVTGDNVLSSSAERDQQTDSTDPATSSQLEVSTSPVQLESAVVSTEFVLEVSNTPVGEDVVVVTMPTDPPLTFLSETTPTVLETAGEDKTCSGEDEIPQWVKYEEDTTVPDDEELKEIEGSEDDKLSALDFKAVEEQFVVETDDPEQRPFKKLRLSWTIKGVRGTRERPNYARVMNSPGALVDGLYWSIKFYPRGDNCSSLSAFVRCSREPPPVDEECPESEFSFYQGAPGTDFSVNTTPEMKITVPARDRSKPNNQLEKAEPPKLDELMKQAEAILSDDVPRESHIASKETGGSAAADTGSKDTPNWRVSAHLAMAIYNPAEPRTIHLQSDGHQFSKYCDDWGWVSFVGPWDEIHRRKRGQRQPLLSKDTLAIDAYIQIYEDPTESLWWHESKDEGQWPSKELAGYFPTGTPGLYHSPAVAGITAWFLLAPFRDILQNVESGKWRCDSAMNPKPLVSQSQLVLDQMRTPRSECYVNVYKIIEELSEVDEKWQDVTMFWEVFRRGLELELADDVEALQKISSIFDAAGARWSIPSLPVPGSVSIQDGLASHLDRMEYHGALPNFLPVMLNRSRFDKEKREWKLHHDRVKLDDELELGKWCSDLDSRFTLYGFAVHVGTRNSGKFYSILRPGGVGTKWLAFEDGNGNKIFSYSKKRIQEFEGLDGDELRNFSASQVRENVYLAMYVRSSCITSYLTGHLEPYRPSQWLMKYTDDPRRKSTETQTEIEEQDGLQIELYLDECVEGTVNMLGFHELRTSPVGQTMCRTVRVGKDTTFRQLRAAITKTLELSDKTRIRLLEIRYDGVGRFSRATLEPISSRRRLAKEAVPGQPMRIWIAVQQSIDEMICYQHLLDRLGELDLRKKPCAESEETLFEKIVEDMDIERLAALIDAENNNRLSSNIDTDEDNVNTAAADVEQTSVAAAVLMDLENISAHQDHISSEIESAAVQAPTAATLVPVINTGEAGPDTIVVPTSAVDDTETAIPVPHGHLLDAVQHTDSTVDIVITHSSAHVSHGDVDALAQILAEDAPMSHATPQVRITAGPTSASTNTVGGTAAPAAREREPEVARVYGYIYLFDADQQTFVAQRPFHPAHDMDISVAIRKHLGYEESRPIRIWKRQGPTGTESVTAGTTFSSAGVHILDVFSFIVGDVLSENKCEELKAAGKFGQPQQLIAYLGMLKRKHPHATITSSDPVEIADYGNDYYKGPLSRGRPHGPNGILITSTGHTYEGAFVAGQKSGADGKMTYQNGDTFVGGWLDDERHGQGEYIELRTGNRYVGGYEKGKRWGQGVTYWRVADQQTDMCLICYEEEIDALFFDCGHVCACVTCAKQCDTCPLCRRSVVQVVKMYRA